MKRAGLAVLLGLVVLGLNGCGKKPRRLDPPDSGPGQTQEVYPKKYPPPDSPDQRL
jgi:hypothetical protein